MKKSFAALAALAVLFGLAACGGSTLPEIPKYGQVVLVSVSQAATGGHPSVSGIVKNVGLGMAGNVKVKCRVLGAGFAVVATAETSLGAIGSGLTAPFTIIFYTLDNWYGCYPTQPEDITFSWN